MPDRRISLAGLLDPAGIAATDQQHVATRGALDKLVGDARESVIGRGYDPGDVGVWAQVCMSGVMDAAFDLAGDDDAEMVLAALTMMLGEAVLRLAEESA